MKPTILIKTSKEKKYGSPVKAFQSNNGKLIILNALNYK